MEKTLQERAAEAAELIVGLSGQKTVPIDPMKIAAREEDQLTVIGGDFKKQFDGQLEFHPRKRRFLMFYNDKYDRAARLAPIQHPRTRFHVELSKPFECLATPNIARLVIRDLEEPATKASFTFLIFAAHLHPDQQRRPVYGVGCDVVTVQLLRRLRIAVIGCSGTGSPVIEQLVRLGVGQLVLVDMDRVEWKNLNRIYLTTAAHANLGRYKVDVLAEEIGRIGLATQVVPLAKDLTTPEVVREVAACDVVFGGMDTAYGRDLLNRLTTFYLLPYIDMGTQIHPLPEGGVDQITGAVHYLQPGKSTLKSRGVYTSDDVRAELLRRDDPAEFRRRRAEGYIKNVQEDQPAVISVNSQVGSMAVNELLARMHRYRNDPNEAFALQQYALHEGYNYRAAESRFPTCAVLSKEVGRGDVVPLLDRAELSEVGVRR